MKAACLMRLTFEPKEVASLAVEDNKVQQGRVQLSMNEGDIRAITLLKDNYSELHALSFGALDNISRVHIFVQGAEAVYEIGDKPARELPEEVVAEAAVKQIETIGDIKIVGLASVEQDTGRTMTPGLIAAKLGWEYISNVITMTVDGDTATIEQQTDEGVQKLTVGLPFCFSSDESSDLGDDPSDEYDLIEKLENKPATPVSFADLGIDESVNGVALESIIDPPQKEAQPIVPISDEAIGQVKETIGKFAS